jgi:hypothetical protein
VITTVAGKGEPGFSGDNGPATLAQLDIPEGVAVDPAGNLYVADSHNNIRKISNGVITTVAGSGVSGFSGDGGPATRARLSNPIGVAVDSAGNFYIADTQNSRIRKVSNGMITTVAGNGTDGFSLLYTTRSASDLTFKQFGRSAIASSGSVAAIFKYASERSPQAPGNPNINHD